MRIIIIPSENKISIDGGLIEGCDLSWVPEFTGDYSGVPQKVHAVQWYDDHGEIELVTNDSNVKITELGVFEQAITIHAVKLAAITARAEAAATSASNFNVDFDINAILAELESEENANVGVATT